MGGEVPAWSELISHWSIHSKVWSRATSLSDKLWGPLVNPPDVAGLVKRINNFAQFWVERGIPITPITGHYCEIHSNHCFAKFSQSEEKFI